MLRNKNKKQIAGNNLGKFKVKRFRKEIDPSEILLDDFARKKEMQIGVSERRLEVPISYQILRGFLFVFAAFLAVIFGKTFQLQILEGKAYAQLSKENQFAVNLIEAERGVIYDKNMTQLVFNSPSFDLVVFADELPEIESEKNEAIRKAAEIIGLEFQEFKSKIDESDFAEIIITEDLSHQNIIILESKKEELPGFKVVDSSEREYLSGPLFSQLIGYKRKNNQTAGLENFYDNLLSSEPGEVYVERDARGRPISKEVVSMPESGKSLVLWLDSGLQTKIIEALSESIAKVGGTGGAAVALDPKTGGVLALVSLPSYDNNLFSQGISAEEWDNLQSDPYHPLFNRAVSGVGYPTGSTIKPLIGAAALEEGVITANTKIYSPLEICIQNPWFPDSKDCYADWKYHGTSDLGRAIAESVNTFFYQVGGGYENFKGLGPTKIKEWLEKFNWGSKTGIDLPKEGDGILPDLTGDWRIGDTYHLSIGQGPFSITPVQVAVAYVAITNGGKIFQPQIIKKIINSNKEITEEIQPRILKEVPISPQNLENVRQGMKQAVTSPQGSSRVLNSLPASAGAKTGTAQTAKENVYHNWVTVFAPYDNPQIVLTVVVENVKGTPEGIPAAVLPVAKRSLEWFFSQDEGN